MAKSKVALPSGLKSGSIPVIHPGNSKSTIKNVYCLSQM